MTFTTCIPPWTKKRLNKKGDVFLKYFIRTCYSAFGSLEAFEKSLIVQIKIDSFYIIKINSVHTPA